MSTFPRKIASTPSTNNEDMELELVLELSKKTFIEEEIKRKFEQTEEDLITIEDPSEIERRETINRIKSLCSNPVVYRNPHQFRPPMISSSHSFNGPFQLQPPPQRRLFPLIQNSQQPSTSAQDLVPLWQQKRNGVFQMGPTLVPSSVPCTPAVELSGPGLNRQPDFKVRSNSLAAENIIDLDDFDPLLKNVRTSLETIQTAESSEDNTADTPTNTSDLTPTLDSNATSYIILDKTLQLFQHSGSNFSKEAEALANYTHSIAFGDNNASSLFLAPSVNYNTTRAESIKLVVTEDKTWPHDHVDFPRRITFTCNIDRICNDILIEVLSELLTPEQLSTGELPLDEYGLRIWGYDEFLDGECMLGRFLFVGNSIAFGQDVRLEVGKRATPINHSSIPFTRPQIPNSMLLNAQNFEVYVKTMLNYINELAKGQNYEVYKQALEFIKLLRSSMNQTLLREIDIAIEAINTATTNKGHEIAISNFGSGIIRQLFAYSRSSYSNFSVKTDALQLPGHRTDSIPIEEAGGTFQFQIESLNNLPKQWTMKYSQFYIQIEAVHGKMSYPLVTIPQRALRASDHDFILYEEQVTIQTLISALPRNTSLSFVILGVPFMIVQQGKRPISQVDDVQLASGVLPLFQFGVMLQGPIMLALSEIHNGRIIPWGPQKLIYQPADIILLLQFPEYEHNIVFPTELPTSQFATFEYERLSEEDRSCIEWMIQHRYIHLFELHDDYKKLLWSKRAYLTKIPLALPLVIISTIAWDFINVSNIYVLLDVWAELPPEDALELLLPCFPDQRVRAKALEWIGKGTSAQLLNFVPQLLEALRYEQHEDSATAKFLLLQATKNRSFAFELYWQLNQRLVAPEELRFRLRYKLLQDQLLELNIPGFQNDLSYQHVFLEKLDNVYRHFKSYSEYSQMNDVLHKSLYSMVEQFDVSRLRLPLCPSFQCKEMLVDRAIHFNSAAKPIALHFNGENAKYSIIYKVGDDLRQDAITMQLVNLINDLWNRDNLDMRMITFKCLPTGRNKGLVEMVSDCSTLREIQVTTGLQGVLATKVLNDWIRSNNPSEFLYKQAVENFRKSCAGWSIISYILGLSDRHNDNMMLCKSGHLFHIDFGKYLGDLQMVGSIKRDRVPFVITQEMANVINQGNMETTEFFQQFVDEMCSAFQCLRKRASVIVNTMRLMSTANIPGLNETAISFVEDKLMLNETDEEAVFLLTNKIVESIQSVYPRINFIAHTIAQGRGNLWELFFGNSVTDFDHMPFNLEDCSKETDGEIVNVYIQGFRKMRDAQDGTKLYLYDCKVKRKNMAEDPLISRTYDDFRNLYLRLCCKFPHVGLPSLGRSRFLVRSNVASVASERFIELQHFLQTLFVLPPEISHCKLIYNFFHHTLQDTEKNGDGTHEESHIASAELDLTLRLNQNNFTFNIRVGHARRLQVNGNNETYVKVYLRTRDNLIVGGGKKKTEVARGMNPTYNKSLTYHLTPIEMSEIYTYVLHVAIWQKTGSIVKDSFAVCECLIILNCLQDLTPNAEKVVEKNDTYRLFYLQ